MTDSKWITDKIIKQGDETLLKLAQQRFDGSTDAPKDAFAADPTGEPVPVDPIAERQAFEDLLAVLNASDDGDPDTTVTALTLADFEQETFTPVEPSTET